MLKKCKKKLFFALATMLLLVSLSIPAAASQDYISWEFNLQANQANSYTTSRYRQTDNIRNPWYCDYAWSSEGSGTVATFWLSKNDRDHTHCAEAFNQTVGYARLYDAWSNANKTDVRLTCENNNYTSTVYQAKGYWDEETW